MPGRTSCASKTPSTGCEDDDPPIDMAQVEADLSDYDILSTLGKGGYGLILEVRKKGEQSGRPQACKAISISSFDKMGTTVKEFVDERLAKIRTLDHPNVVRTIDHRQTDSAVYIFMDKVSQRTLIDRINDSPNGRIVEADAKKLARSLCRVIDYFHSQLVIHRDIKCDNFWFWDDDAPYEDVLVGDMDAMTIRETSKQRFRSNGLGTPSYMAPEIVKLGLCSAKVDEFALGMSLVEVLTGSSLMLGEEPEDLKEELLHEDFTFDHEAWRELSADSLDFIKKLVRKDAKERMSASEALRHPWLSGKRSISPSPDENVHPSKTRRTK